jgi:hypothetical protein
VDDYIEHGRRLPNREVVLQTQDADYFYFKSDILEELVTYSTDKRLAVNLETITAQRAKEIIEMNRRGEKPAQLQPDDQKKEPEGPIDLLAGDSITRFDKAKKKKKKKAAKPAEARSAETRKAEPRKTEPHKATPKNEAPKEQ